MISNAEVIEIHYDVILNEVHSDVSGINLLSEVDEDYRRSPYRITEETNLRATESEDIRQIES